jgi:hypothetical protein
MICKYISSCCGRNVFCTRETVRRLCSASEKLETVCFLSQSQELSSVELASLRQEMRLAGAWMQSILKLNSRSKDEE